MLPLLLSALLPAGCLPQRCSSPSADDRPPAAPERPAAAAALQGAAAESYVPCTRLPALEGLAQPLVIGGGELMLQDGALVPRPASSAAPVPGQRQLLLGVLADLKLASPANLAQLDALAAAFVREGAAAALLLGGGDPTYEGTRAILERLASKLPVLALPGDRVSAAGFRAAAENVAGPVVDLTRVRAVLLPGASLLGVGGYALPHHLQAAEQGCSYSTADLEQLAQRAAAVPAPRVLLSYGPPRGQGPLAPDRAHGGVNIGDPRLNRLLTQGDFAVGLFGHVQEAAGLATTREGEPLGPGVWSESLLLQVGAADGVPHEDLAGNFGQGTAALVELIPGKVRFRLLRGPSWR